MAELLQSAPGLTLAQAQDLLEASGWPRADASTLTMAAQRMVGTAMAAADALQSAQTPREGDFATSQPSPAASPAKDDVPEAVILAVKASGLSSERRLQLQADAKEHGIKNVDEVRGIAPKMRVLTCGVAEAHEAWKVAQVLARARGE